MKKQMIAGAVLASCVVLPMTVAAETKPLDAMESDLFKCFAMTDEQKRLVCYDDISRNLADAKPEKKELAEKRAVADFGLTHQTQSFDELELQAVKVEKNPSGDWVITMENGQVWEQTKEQDYRFRSNQPKVRIFKLLFGSYAMTEEGRTKKLRVKRIN